MRQTKDQIAKDIEAGTNDAADRGKISALPGEDQERILEILIDDNKIVTVNPGEEVVMTNDVGTLKIQGDQGNSGVGLPLDRIQCILVQERSYCTDTMELAHTDYSFKPIKPIISMELQCYEQAELLTVIPLFYGAMPNLGLYYATDGPFPNPTELYMKGKIKEGKEAQEAAAERAATDMTWVGKKFDEIGCEGLNFDTTAAAGDADFYATLVAAENLSKSTNVSMEMGMSGETVLGFHGGFEFHGKRLAGMYPHEQVKVAEKAGVRIFGPVVNTKANRSLGWNLARAVTFVKECAEVSEIPVHVNMGMGVGGVPMFETPPEDAVSRASKAMVQVARVDGV